MLHYLVILFLFHCCFDTVPFISFFAAHHAFDTIPELAYKLTHKLDELTADHENAMNITHREKRAFTDFYNNEKPLTLYIVMDQSGSIAKEHFDYSILFMKTLIKKVSITSIL